MQRRVSPVPKARGMMKSSMMFYLSRRKRSTSIMSRITPSTRLYESVTVSIEGYSV